MLGNTAADSRALTIILNEAGNILRFAISNDLCLVVAARKVERMAETFFMHFVPQACQHAFRLPVTLLVQVRWYQTLALCERQAKNLVGTRRMDRLDVNEGLRV